MSASSPPKAAPAIDALEPYVSARMLHGFRPGATFLDANEMPVAPPAVSLDQSELNRYADQTPFAMSAAYARYAGVAEAQILATRGIDEGIDLLIRAYCGQGEGAMAVLPPTYGMYSVCAAVNQTEVLSVPLMPDGEPDLAALRALPVKPKVIFLCRPNNPTGEVMSRAAVAAVAEWGAGEVIVAVDEAYIEFCLEESVTPLLSQYTNLVVLRTLSKGFGLAGLHTGFAIGHEEVVLSLKKISNPYPIPEPCAQIALAALSGEARAAREERIAAICAVRDRFAERLASHPQAKRVLPSKTNFVLGQFEDGAGLAKRLDDEGLFVRPVGAGLPGAGWVRFSIGTAEEMEKVATALGV